MCINSHSSNRKKRDLTQRVKRETREEMEMRSFGSRLRYECGLARKFLDPETNDHYDERWMQCNWNNSWTLYDSLDDCVWVQCLYPPDPPPDTQLAVTWSGDPVEFHDNVSYVCDGEDLYFEWEREMEEFNVTCLPGGAWDNPIEWPICVHCKLKKNFQSFCHLLLVTTKFTS